MHDHGYAGLVLVHERGAMGLAVCSLLIGQQREITCIFCVFCIRREKVIGRMMMMNKVKKILRKVKYSKVK